MQTPDANEQKAQTKIARQMLAHLQQMVGKRVLFYIAGPAMGSVVDLHLGQQRVRPEPLKNAYLTQDQQAFEGEFSIFISCAWRLDAAKGIACGCWDDNETGADMMHGLDKLEGRKLTGFKLRPPAYDLTLEFDGGFALHAFCDQTNDFEGGDNFSIFSGDRILTVANRSYLSVEAREADVADIDAADPAAGPDETVDA